MVVDQAVQLKSTTTAPETNEPDGQREAILARVRKALETPKAGHHTEREPDRGISTNGMPFVADTWESKVAAMVERCAALKTEFVIVPDRAALRPAFRLAIGPPGLNGSARRLAIAAGPLVAGVLDPTDDVLRIDAGYDPAILEQCEVGLTDCYCLVAQTGSVIVTSHANGGRALSVLPPHHIVLATVDQLLPDLASAYARFVRDADRRRTSMLSVTSGPSRTGDIERILVLGAHGPKRLTILLVGDK